jgi:hypothetical protein
VPTTINAPQMTVLSIRFLTDAELAQETFLEHAGICYFGY